MGEGPAPSPEEMGLPQQDQTAGEQPAETSWEDSSESYFNSQLSSTEAKQTFLRDNPKPADAARLQRSFSNGEYKYRWNAE
jgi:hypothetical protein